jgi:2-polyprenyl-6-methoxyphenol hydroxylase-like FAD-dependent oxidoreductase
MCAGIRDAANLGCKLARVQAGLADAALLDSCESERAPHARACIETAVRLGGLINTRAMKAAVPGSALSGAPPPRMESIRPPLESRRSWAAGGSPPGASRRSQCWPMACASMTASATAWRCCCCRAT